MTYKNDRMLVFAPHCDDAEFGLGGWMSKARRDGAGIFKVIVACDGSYTRSDGVAVDGDRRAAEAFMAMRSLGVDDFEIKGWFKENAGLSVHYPSLVQSIAIEVDVWNPTEVFVCLPSFNQDHRVLHDALITAFRPGCHPGVKHIWMYPYPGSFATPGVMPTQTASYIVLTKEDVQAKMIALSKHRSQFDGREVGVNPRAALINMTQWGSEIGVDYAEKLYLWREIHR